MRMKICGRLFIVFIMALALIPGGYGTTVGGGTSLSTSGGCSASGNFVASNTGVAGQSSSTGTGIANLADNHWVVNKAGAFAMIAAYIKGATKPYTYSYSMYPGEHGGMKTSYVDASENLNVPNAAQIDTYAGAYNLAGYATSVSTDVTGGSLLGYQNSAWASADKVDASQTFDTATGTIKTNSGSYTWLILPETGINTKVTGELTNYKDDTSKSKSTRSSSQVGHIAGSFTSTAKSGTNTKTRTSNYGTTYDLNMQASKDSSSSSVSGILGYYVDGTKTWQGSPMTIQGGVNAAQSGDTINAAAGMYKENVAIDKSLAVKGAGAGTDPTKNTIVDGNQAGSVFTIGKTNPNVDVTLSGMTVQGGTGTIFTGENGWKYLAGGGILNYGTLTLDGISITGNKAIYGAGIHNLGTVTMNSGSSIKDNQGQRGGGIANVPGSTLTMNPGSSITGNTAFWGSGILNWGTVMMNSGSSITGNTASAGDGANGEGGGIYNAKTVIMNSGSSIACNTAEFGGGIFNVGYGITMNSGSSITSNKATSDGGGFYNYGGTLNMYVGSSITSNKAARYGGGICNTGTTDSGIGTVTFKDSAGNPVAYWPGYDSNADLYGFFTPHNTPNDIVDTPLTQS